MSRIGKQERHGLRTWIEIDRKAIKHNFGVFRGLISSKTNPPQSGLVKLMAVVKSNAYGSDLIQFGAEMEKLGADFLGVDSMTEARALRRDGVMLPILVLGYTMPELFAEAVENNISVTVSTFAMLEAITKAKLSKPLKIHIKVDTGMHRQGFLLSDIPAVLKKLSAKNYQLQAIPEGLFTHFASAKNPSFPKDTKDQISEFKIWIGEFKKAGITPIIHASATAGTMLFPEAHFDMVRIGIGLYGLWPAKEVREYLRDHISLIPVLTWKGIVTEVKSLPRGSRIGYDLTEALSVDSKVAVVPIGYWHGYPRALSSIGRVVVRGKECRVLGRVSMDMVSIDVTAVKGVQVEDEVVIIGPESAKSASAEGISDILDASWYEVVTRTNPLIKRIYT